MKKVHERLVQYPWYDVWHKRKGYARLHWVIFSAFVLFLTTFTVSHIFGIRIFQEGGFLASVHKIEFLGFTNRDTADQRILISFHEPVGQNDRALLMRRHGLTQQSIIDSIGVYVVTIPRSQKPEEVVARLLAREGGSLEYAEVDALLEPTYIPNDPSYADEWHHATINSPLAWDKTQGSGTVIAVADSGVDSAHPDLVGHLVPGWNFIENNSNTNDVYGHGTRVAGAAAAIGDNNTGVAGVAYKAGIMPLRVSDTNGYAYISTIANAITYSGDNGVRIVNVSYRIGGNRTISKAARYLAQKGGVVVASEGNTGNASGLQNDEHIISVSATDWGDTFSSWSTYGKDVDVSAPGLAILTTNTGEGTGTYSGTSFSAPITSGVIALMWSANPALTPSDIRNALFTSAHDLGDSGWDEYFGWGRVDAHEAVQKALHMTPTTIPSTGPPGKNK